MDFRRISLLLIILGLTAPYPLQAQDAAKKSKYDELTEGLNKQEGMWTSFHNDQKLLVELSPAALKKEYMIIPSISKGISRGNVLGGMSLGFGDDVIWAFKKSDDKIFLLQRNVRFRATDKSPEASAVKMAYSDSILFALPELAKSPNGGILLDFTRVFMNDDQEIGQMIGGGFRFMSDRSTWEKIKTFPENFEIQVNAVYSGSGQLDTVVNTKGVQVGLHYSVSELPAIGTNGYKPRVADDRIGYFLTAIKDFSDKDDPEHFVRYINRWNLEKLDAKIDVSPPKEPIKFYIEDTVPVYLRPTIEAGIMEWNKAFEKLGFAGAIKVDQQPDDPNFDPENIHYNTFRWLTADAGFAMGPSRVDPRTGQILDADIIFDASFLDGWNSRWEAFRAEDIARLAPNWSPFKADGLDAYPLTHQSGHQHSKYCTYCQDSQQQLGFAATVLMARGIAAEGGNLPKELIHQGLKEVVMHEVGHTLGLRHNFKASAWKSIEEINDLESGKKEGTIASVMDYAPANIAVDKDKQGLYYSQTLGPYDIWAIEYGYKPIDSKEDEELKKIASRSGEPALEYATDEDTRYMDSDPLSNRFDLGTDPLAFVKRQIEHTTKLMPEIVEKTVKDGEGYQRARQAFGLLMSEYWRSIAFASRFPGGVYVHRDHKGDKDGQAPFEVVDVAKQREAMQLIADTAFSAPEINGSQLNYMSASRWSHWGTRDMLRLDYPIHDVILKMQDMVLMEVLSPMTLERILDSEFKVDKDNDAYTLAEHLKFVTDSVFSEWKSDEEAEFTNRKPLIDSFRRNLQRRTLERLGNVVSHGLGAPSDARTLTRMQLATLKDQADSLLKNKKIKLDDYSKAHLLESSAQIDKLLNSGITLPSIN